MAEENTKHVFISYVREDTDEVDRLCAILTASQIPYWRDLTSLEPGDAWKAKIRNAIRGDSLVFLACFSQHSRNRDRSTMNEELTLAVEEFRKMAPGRTWLVPIRFDDGPVPDWDLGAGRALGDLQYTDFFGAGYTVAATSLVTTIHRLNGEKRLPPASTLAAVEQATDANRASILTKLTKEMLLDPSRRIELDDLVSQETRRVVDGMKDTQRFPRTLQVRTGDEQVIEAVELAQRYWLLVEPFCHSLRVAARWAAPDALGPWVSGLRGMIAAACQLEGGNETALALRHIPGVVAMMTAGLACVSTGRWENLKSLVVDPTILSTYDNSATVRLIHEVSPWSAFPNTYVIPNVLARCAVERQDLAAALQHVVSKSKYRTPVAEWLQAVLRPLFSDQLHDDADYFIEFDRAEVFLGLLDEDVSLQAASVTGDAWRRGSRWFGRSTWRAAQGRGDPVAYFDGQFTVEGRRWPPLLGGLFGADEVRAREAIDNYRQSFEQLKNRRF